MLPSLPVRYLDGTAGAGPAGAGFGGPLGAAGFCAREDLTPRHVEETKEAGDEAVPWG